MQLRYRAKVSRAALASVVGVAFLLVPAGSVVAEDCDSQVADEVHDVQGLAYKAVALIGRVTDMRLARSSGDRDYAVHRYTFRVERMLWGTPDAGPMTIETSWQCPGVAFPTDARLLISTRRGSAPTSRTRPPGGSFATAGSSGSCLRMPTALRQSS